MCQRCDQARAELQQWCDKQGHERCWYYPDIFRALCRILEVVPSTDPALPPLPEFQQGCCLYQQEEYKLLEPPTSTPPSPG